MSNIDTIIEFLEARQPNSVCDDCISQETNVEPRQQVNQICRRLERKGIIARSQEKCSVCESNKICNKIFSTDTQTLNLFVKEASTQYSIKQIIPREETFDIRDMRDHVVRFCRLIASAKILETAQNGVSRLISELRDSDLIPSHQSNMMLTICGLRNSYSYEKIDLGQNEIAVIKGAWAIIQEWATQNFLEEWNHSRR